jgi:outer membrane protein OmpA-like peptidoglycan-associated protein
VAQAQRYVAEGYNVVVDLDLEKFFDRVNHDSLMARVAARVADKRVLKLIRAFLNAVCIISQEKVAGSSFTPRGLLGRSPTISCAMQCPWMRAPASRARATSTRRSSSSTAGSGSCGSPTRWLNDARIDPAALKELVIDIKSGKRMSTTFRFARGSSQLDSKSVLDIGRLARFVQFLVERREPRTLVLAGFTDSTGDFAPNSALSLARAKQVRDIIVREAKVPSRPT